MVFSSSVTQHLERLEVVLGRMKREGLKSKLDKCAFFKQHVKYLGHVGSSQQKWAVELETLTESHLTLD